MWCRWRPVQAASSCIFSLAPVQFARSLSPWLPRARFPHRHGLALSQEGTVGWGVRACPVATLSLFRFVPIWLGSLRAAESSGCRRCHLQTLDCGPRPEAPPGSQAEKEGVAFRRRREWWSPFTGTAWPPGLWPWDSALDAFMPSAYGMEGSGATGPRSWPPLPPPREAPLGPPLQSQEWWPDGASWGRVDQLWPRSSPKGSPYYAALWPHLPVGTWGSWITGTQSGEDQLSWAFLLPFSFYLPQGFYFYFCVHFF